MLGKILRKLKLDMKFENSQTFFHKIAFFVKKGLDFGFNKCYYRIVLKRRKNLFTGIM